MTDDRRMGHVPATSYDFNAYPDIGDEGGLGPPLRVIEAWAKAHDAKMKARLDEVQRRQRIEEFRVYWVHMTRGDTEALIARGLVNPARVDALGRVRAKAKALPCWHCGAALSSGHYLSCPVVNATTQQEQYDRLAGITP